MKATQRVGWIGLTFSAVALAGGAMLAALGALVGGGWSLAREPWIGIGLYLIVAGLLSFAVFGVLLDIVEPLGRVRLLALPPAVALAALWLGYLVIGQMTVGHGGATTDLRWILHSDVRVFAWFVVLTLAVALPLAIVRVSHSIGKRTNRER